MKDRIRLAWLAGAVALVYGNSLSNGFTRDDDLYVLTNPQVTHPSLASLFAPHHVSHVFRPLTFASFALNWAVEGANPLGYHLVNILLHAAAVCLLYLLVRTLLSGSMRVPQADTLAFVAALLFAVHPIQTEAVSSVSARPDLLAAAFLFAACLFHLDDREIPALACFVLAVLSKESAVILLPLLLVFDYVRGQWKSRFRYARLGAITALYLAALWMVQGRRFGAPAVAKLDNPLVGLPAGWRILNALRVAWHYVALEVYPRTLSCDYSFNQIPVYLDWRHTLPAAFAALAVLAAWIWALRKRQGALALAGGIYFAGFATTANILIPIGTIMGERLAYFSSAGFCLLVAAAWFWLFNESPGQPETSPEPKIGFAAGGRSRALALALLAIIVASLGVRSVVRNLDWRNDLTLSFAAVQATPRSAKMHAYLGSSYVDAGRDELAAKEFQTALAIYPEYPDALEAYGLIEFRKGDYQSAGWLLEKAFYISDRTNTTYDTMAVNLAAVYMRTNHWDGALALLNREIDEAPNFGRAWAARAIVRYQLGQTSAASADAKMALHLDSDNVQAQTVLSQPDTSLFSPPQP